jgi:N-acetylneuraminate synthase
MPVEFIAEVSSNHHGDLERSLAFVDAAADLKCAAVKFQLFRIRELFAIEALRAKPELLLRESWELNPDFLPPIAARCRARGIKFACTPFYIDAVEQLRQHVDFFKVASYELLWDDLLRACAATGKPTLLSTGMATVDEIQHAVSVVRDAGGEVSLLHCISGYPTPVAECNLAAIDTLRAATGCAVGWSDHSVSPAVLYRAVHRWGVQLIEFHLDLDGTGDEFKTGHCWLPRQVQELISTISDGFLADGTARKAPGDFEAVERMWRADPADGLRPLRDTRVDLR